MQQYLDIADLYRILIIDFLQNPKVFLIGWVVTTIILSNLAYFTYSEDERKPASITFMFFMCFAVSSLWEFGLLLLIAIIVLFLISFIITLPSRIILCLTRYRLVKRDK